MKKNNKFELTIIFIVIIFSIIMYGLYLILNEYNKQYNFTLITTPLTILNCKKYNCTKEDIKDYQNVEYNTNIDGIDYGINTLYYNEINKKFYIFDKYNKSKDYTNFYMYTGNIKGYKLNIQEIPTNELNILKTHLELNISTNASLTTEKLEYDFDNDSKTEVLYNIRITDDIYYNYLIYKDNDKYMVLYESKEEDITKFSAGTIDNILDIFDDKKLEFIYHVSFYDEIGECAIVYRLKGKKFVKLNECSI